MSDARVYEINGREVVITRREARWSERHDPADFFVWDASVDGERAAIGKPGISVAYRAARALVTGEPDDRVGVAEIKDEMESTFRYSR